MNDDMDLFELIGTANTERAERENEQRLTEETDVAEDNEMWVVCWLDRRTAKSGQGMPVSHEIAKNWRNEGRKNHREFLYWIERVSDLGPKQKDVDAVRGATLTGDLERIRDRNVLDLFEKHLDGSTIFFYSEFRQWCIATFGHYTAEAGNAVLDSERVARLGNNAYQLFINTKE